MFGKIRPVTGGKTNMERNAALVVGGGRNWHEIHVSVGYLNDEISGSRGGLVVLAS